MLAAAFFWPWIAVGVGIGRVTDLASMVSLGVNGVVIIGAIMAYRETKTQNIAYRSAAGVALATAFILNWMIPAVGVLGRDGDPADLMYMGVLAVGFIGALIARFQPQGMARALFGTALAQALVAGIALIAGMHQSPISSVAEILALNGFFVALWVGSAMLFRTAAREDPNGARRRLL